MSVYFRDLSPNSLWRDVSLVKSRAEAIKPHVDAQLDDGCESDELAWLESQFAMPADVENKEPNWRAVTPENSKGSFQDEEEMNSWLSYPMESSAEKNYCSGLFGDLPANPTMQHHLILLGDSHQNQKVPDNSDTAYGVADADIAMAMGAARAAGLLPPPSCPKYPFKAVHTTLQPNHDLPSSTNLKSLGVHPALDRLQSCNTMHALSGTSRSSTTPTKANLKQQLSFEESRSATKYGTISTCTNTDAHLSSRSYQLQQDADATKEQRLDLESYTTSSVSAVLDQEAEVVRIPQLNITVSRTGSGNSTEDSCRETDSTFLKRKATQGDESEHHTESSKETATNGKKHCSAKRSRAAEIHNLSERRRREKINEKMRALQELLPNSNKTDKASMLDEAIEYLKMLQSQLQMMFMRTGIGIPPTMMPMEMLHHQMPAGMNMGATDVGDGATLQPFPPQAAIGLMPVMDNFQPFPLPSPTIMDPQLCKRMLGFPSLGVIEPCTIGMPQQEFMQFAALPMDAHQQGETRKCQLTRST